MPLNVNVNLLIMVDTSAMAICPTPKFIFLVCIQSSIGPVKSHEVLCASETTSEGKYYDGFNQVAGSAHVSVVASPWIWKRP